MGEDTRGAPREFQLETRHLAAVIFVVALLCIGSFILGRWVERKASGATAAGLLESPGAESLSVEDVNKELTYFRTLEGEQPAPQVDAPQPERAPAPLKVDGGGAITEESVGGAAAPAGGADVMVQVMATKDLSSAIAMRQKLLAKGYPVEIVQGTGGAAGSLHRVRVGPYADRKAALAAAKKLEAEEGIRTWIP